MHKQSARRNSAQVGRELGWLRWGLAILSITVAGLVGCSDANPTDDERLGVARQAVNGGTVDTTEQYSAVVGVLFNFPGGTGFATGVALSDRVVATAGHLVPRLINGCEGFHYGQPSSPGSSPTTRLWVQTVDANGNAFPPGPDPANQYGVDAVVGRRRVAPLNAYDCCDGEASGCAACSVIEDKHNWLLAFDVALVHLDRPLQGVVPMNFVARIGPTDAMTRTYPIDPSTWPDSVLTTIVGVGSDNLVNGVVGPRKFGLNTVIDRGWRSNTMYSPSVCGMTSTTKYQCDDCMLTITGRSTPLLPSGGPERLGGDSGAPLIVNDTAHGGTPIAGLPEGPFVVGFGIFGTCPEGGCSQDPHVPVDDHSIVTWDTTLGPDDPIGMGTFIQSHLADWDQDGVPDKADNCVLASNPDQANCNADAEQARGFEVRGDACDPIPCAALASAEGSLVGEWAFVSTFLDIFGGTVIHDRIVVEPQGSHYFSSGAQNHTLLPELSVGAVPTHYRYCQPDEDFAVECNETVIGHNEYLSIPPAAPPDPSRSWLPATMETTATPPVLVGDQELMSHPAAASRKRRWDYTHDFDEWLTLGWISPPAGCGSILCCYQGDCITGLDGTLWARSSTTRGTAANPVHGVVSAFLPPNTGFHPKGGAPSSDDVHLSNSYLPLKPDSIFIRMFGRPLAPWPYFFWRWSWPDPAPRPWRDLLRQDTFLMPLDQGHVGLLLADGKAVVADELVGRPLMAALTDPDTRWVDAVEPLIHTASPTLTSAIQLVGLSANGTRMTSLVTGENTSGCVPPSDTMIGWWPLDGDASDGAPLSPWHDGTYHRQVATAPGLVGEAASFPKPGLFGPSSYVKVDNSDGAFDLANDFTVEAWVYPTQFQLAPQELVGRGASGWRVGILPLTKTLYAGKGLQVIATPVRLTAKEWQHVAVSFTPAGTVFYVNGVRIYTDTSFLGKRDIHYGPLLSKKPLTFGAGADLILLGTRPFVGRLDEVSIYDEALTDAELAAIADAGSAGKCKAPAVATLAAPDLGAAPSPRADYTAVFSRAENALFVLGGKDPLGAPLHDLWMQRIEPPGAWTELLPASYEPGEILDAVWSYADHRLWILDSQVIDGVTTVRLVRIEPYLGTTQVLGQWSADPSVLGRWLILDRDGQVLLIATSAERYGVVRVEVVPFEDALPARPSLTVRDGRLAFRPLVDATGYSFVRKSSTSDALDIDRVAELAFARSSLANLEPALAPGR